MSEETTPTGCVLTAAVAAVQAAMTPVPKNREAKVTKKDGTYAYSFRFADLEVIEAMLRPLIADQGLAVTQPGVFEGGQWMIRTTVTHPDSEKALTGDTPIVWSGNCQQFGIGQSYARRYGLAAFFRVVTDEDVDGEGAGNPTEKQAEGAEGSPQETVGRRGSDRQGGERRPRGSQRPQANALQQELRHAKGKGWDTAGFVAREAAALDLTVDKTLFDRIDETQAKTLRDKLHEAAPEIFPTAGQEES